MNVSRLSDVSLDLLLTFLLLGCSAQTLLIIHPRVILLFQHKHSPEIYVESGFDFRKMLHIFDFAVKQQTQSWFLNLNSSVQIPQRFSHQLLLLQQLLQIWKRSFMFPTCSWNLNENRDWRSSGFTQFINMLFLPLLSGDEWSSVSVTARWSSGLERSPHSTKVLGSNLWRDQQCVLPVSVGSLWFLHLPPIETWGCVLLVDLNHSWVWMMLVCLCLCSSVFDWQVTPPPPSLWLSEDEWCRWWRIKKRNIKKLTMDRYICLSVYLVVDLLLCGDTAIEVGLGHSRLEDDVVAASSFRDLRFFSRNNVSSSVLPMNFRFWRRTSNRTLQLNSFLCFTKCFDDRLWSCSCEHRSYDRIIYRTELEIRKTILEQYIFFIHPFSAWFCVCYRNKINSVCVRIKVQIFIVTKN